MLRWTVHLEGGAIEGHLYTPHVAVGHKVFYIGDSNSNVNNSDQIDMHVLNTESLCWRKLPPVTSGSTEHVPSRRQAHIAVLIECTIYIWGGGIDYCNVLYAFNVDTRRWFKHKVSGTVPGGRSFHSACVLRKVIFIHGGYIQTGCNDTYKLDTTSMVWSLINTRGTPPPVSYFHSATIIGTKMFVFGGFGVNQGQGGMYNDTRVFDTNCWLNTPSARPLPERRCGHSAFTYNGELYILGGHDQEQKFTDMWKFNPETFSWKEVEPRGKCPLGPMNVSCCTLVGDLILLFGRYNGIDVSSDDLIILDLSPTLKTLCKLVVIQYCLEQSELPHNIRWELAAMTTNQGRNFMEAMKAMAVVAPQFGLVPLQKCHVLRPQWP